MVYVNNQGGIFLISPSSDIADEFWAWIEEHVGTDYLTFGDGLVVEHRFVGQLLGGLAAAGFRV